MSAELPDDVARWVEIGLETGEQDDRLVALRAAHLADPWQRAHYGLRVAERFLEQAGLTLEPVMGPVKGEMVTVETRRTGEAMQVVSRVLGPELGIRSSFEELVGRDRRDRPIVARTGSANSEAMVAIARSELVEEKPIVATHKYDNNSARRNFFQIVESVMGPEAGPAASPGRGHNWIKGLR